MDFVTSHLPAVRAQLDSELCARILSRFPLRFAQDDATGKSYLPQLRTYAGMAWLPLGYTGTPQRDTLVALQEDASLVALIDADTGLALQSCDRGAQGAAASKQPNQGAAGKDPRHGFSSLNLEACTVGKLFGAPHVLAFGALGDERRARIVLAACQAGRELHLGALHVADARALCSALRKEPAFLGLALRCVGVVVREDLRSHAPELVLFLHGRSAGSRPLNGLCVLPWAEFAAHLESDGALPLPRLSGVTVYDLGTSEDAQVLHFTCAGVATRASHVWFAAAPEIGIGGRAQGSFVGVIGADGRVRMARLLDEAGLPVAARISSLVRDVRHAQRAVVSVDHLDGPSELLHVALEGPWL